MRCPRCDYDNLAGSQFCEKCGHNLTGVKVRPHPDYRSNTTSKAKDSYAGPCYTQRPTPAAVPTPASAGFASGSGMAPTPAPRPAPVGCSPAPAPQPMPVGHAPAPAPQPMPVGHAPAPAPQPVPLSAVPASAPAMAQSPLSQVTVTSASGCANAQAATPGISSEEAVARSQAYAALEAVGGQPVFYLTREISTIGRSPDNDVSLHDTSHSGTISRHHARLVWQSEGVFVEDLGSSNGTHVNGERLLAEVQKQIFDNDEIRFGAARFIVHLRRKG